MDEFEPLSYCCIRDLYVYEDEKIFNVEVLKIIHYNEHLRAIELKLTGQTMWHVYADFLCHGTLHLKKKDESIYIIEQQFWMYDEQC